MHDKTKIRFTQLLQLSYIIITRVQRSSKNYDKNAIHLPRQCLRNGAKALSLLGSLDGNVEFTPLEDRIGIVRTGKV